MINDVSQCLGGSKSGNLAVSLKGGLCILHHSVLDGLYQQINVVGMQVVVT